MSYIRKSQTILARNAHCVPYPTSRSNVFISVVLV